MRFVFRWRQTKKNELRWMLCCVHKWYDRQKKLKRFRDVYYIRYIKWCILLPDFTLVNAPCQWKQLFSTLNFILTFLFFYVFRFDSLSGFLLLSLNSNLHACLHYSSFALTFWTQYKTKTKNCVTFIVKKKTKFWTKRKKNRILQEAVWVKTPFWIIYVEIKFFFPYFAFALGCVFFFVVVIDVVVVFFFFFFLFMSQCMHKCTIFSFYSLAKGASRTNTPQ